MNEKKILFIDDDRDLLMSAQAFFNKRGHQVTIAHNGTEGLDAILKEKPDIIILDIMMDSDTEGFNLAYRIKEDPSLREIPIIIYSGFGQHLEQKISQFEFILGKDWPADALIEKPGNLDEILQKVERVLEERATQRERLRLVEANADY